MTAESSSPQDTAILIEAMKSRTAGTLMERMEIELLEVTPDRIVGRMPVTGNTQPFGLLHGGASAVLAETLGSIGSVLHAQKDGRIAVGIELNCSHHRAAHSGFVTGVATPVSRSRSLATFDIEIFDDQERKICTCRLTCMLRDAPPHA